jgi:hypothetical protein
MSTSDDPGDDLFDKAFQEYCAASATADPASRVLCGRLVLAALTGYAYRNIEFFSTLTDAKNDARAVLDHVGPSLAALKTAEDKKDSPIFLVYRSDYIVELAQTAAVAAQPALRAGRNLIGGPGVNQIATARKFLEAVLTDVVYLDAYKRACKDVLNPNNAQAAESALNERIAMRCTSIAAYIPPSAGADGKAASPGADGKAANPGADGKAANPGAGGKPASPDTKANPAETACKAN